MSRELIDRPLKELLSDVAAPTPAPGGGCCAGWACALAAGLVEMTAAFTLRHSGHEDRHERMAHIAGRAGELGLRARQLAEQELYAYEPVLAAMALPSEHPDRAAQLDAALGQAAETPLALARVGAEVVELALEASRTGTSHLRGDALAGLLLAEGACQAAGALVAINLAGRPEDERLIELAALTRDAAAARAQAL
jgi:methenyltetrahydrofolate cyclohydrolase